MTNCPTCNRLRKKWQDTATPLTIMDGKAIRVIDADRAKPEYQAAKAAYRKHIKECRNDWQILSS